MIRRRNALIYYFNIILKSHPNFWIRIPGYKSLETIENEHIFLDFRDLH